MFAMNDSLLHAVRESVRQILLNAHAYQWSLQGMGMLRLHMASHTRLHVWDSRYRVPGVSMIHDHLQWDLESTIVAGQLRNQRYDEYPGVQPVTHDYGVLKPGYGCYFKSPVKSMALDPRARETYNPGDTYRQVSHEVHETDAEDGTVTILRKYPTSDESARVFWPTGEKWGSAEPRAATTAEVIDITQLALQKWF